MNTRHKLLESATLALLPTAVQVHANETQSKTPVAGAAIKQSGPFTLDVVVTARRREERLQDVPLAVSAVSPLTEGLPGEPVVAIRGMAAVRDANLQANAERYVAETGFEMFSYGLSWSQAKHAVWYLTRIIIEVTPETFLWWDNADAMEEP